MTTLESRPSGVRCPCGSHHTYWRKWQRMYRCRTCKLEFLPPTTIEPRIIRRRNSHKPKVNPTPDFITLRNPNKNNEAIDKPTPIEEDINKEVA